MVSWKIREKVQDGFTLIELLVVIGILGILAGALFFTIDPLEQIRRGEDASKKQVAESFTTATSSYYATQRAYPWEVVECNLNETPLFDGNTVNSCVEELISKGELRESFDDSTDVLSEILVTEKVDGGFSVCFQPESIAEQTSSQAVYDAAGVEDETCTDGECYWCIVQ